MGEIPDIPSKMMISSLLLLTFLSMAVGAPQHATSRQLTNRPGEVEFDEDSVTENDTRAEPFRDLTAAPPPEDLLGYSIFTTYHLLLKDIRNEAGETEIVAKRTQGGAIVEPNEPEQEYQCSMTFSILFLFY